MHGSNTQRTADLAAPRIFAGTQQTEDNPWRVCKQRLADRIPAPFFETFIQPIQLDETLADSQQLRLFVSTDKLKKHIESRYFSLIESTLLEMKFQGQVSLSTGRAAPAPRSVETGAQPHNTSLSRNQEHPAAAPKGAIKNARHPHDPSWKSSIAFHPHASNEAATERLLCGKQPEAVLVISGPAGSGKSTLAMCAAREARARGSSARYVPLEVFLTEFSLACRERNVIDWRRELRSHELLIIDDVQFIKKTASKSQEELRHLIDDLERTDSRLILISDASLRSLPLQADLQSRLYLAGELKLTYPDEPARLKILTEAVELAGRLHDLPGGHKPPNQKMLQLAASLITGDGRRLVGAARKLALLGDADLDSVRRALEGLVEQSGAPASPERVIDLVARTMQVSAAAICGPARDKRYALARHMVAYLCTQALGMKLTDTARAIGRREHGSVIHARRRIVALMERDLFFRGQIQELTDQLLNPL